GGRRGKGIVFLWAAGNENCPISHDTTIPVPVTHGWEQDRFGQWRWVGVRTATHFSHDLVGIPGVMHIAALASTAQRSHYSNYGTGIDICAPTSNSHRFSRLELDGLGITTTTGEGPMVRNSFGGTSSATPLVAGIAALVISANPQLTALEVIGILKSTASKDLDMTGYPRTPPASYNRDTSWDVSPIAPFDGGNFADNGDPEGTWSPWFGHGKVDAARAVQRAKEMGGARSRTVKVERIASLSIPDNDPAGVSSTIFVSDRGAVQSLSLQVDITHTYIGDLIVRLVGPNGTAVELHRRAEGRTQNIRRTYDAVTTTELALFHGLDIKGNWSLEVSDHASIDEGKLNRWSLEAVIADSGELRVQSSPGMTIPDNKPAGINDTITVSDTRPVNDLRVEVDITHTWIGDLKIELTGPGGSSVLLHDRTGGSDQNIQTTFGPADKPDLVTFLGQPANGDWTLKVSDHQGRDVGKFNHWALSIT
ncbi:MAG: S8 family serine peptidase, partial [bacterium]|nr:S8 family serine peptidase [bacterium]